jgi:hypothetical protein
LVKLMEMRRLAPLSDLVGRIAELESALRTGRPPAERKSPQSAPGGSSETRGRAGSSARPSRSASASELAAPEETATQPPADVDESASPEISSTSIVETSGSLIDQIKAALEQRKKKLLVVSLDAAVRIELEGDDLSIEFSPAAKHSRDTLAKSDNAKILREVCADVCGRDIGVRFSIRNGESDDAPISREEDDRRSKQRARQAAAQNPTVQQVLRTFGGEIVDVKMP